MSDEPKFCKIEFDISAHYPPEIVRKISRNLKNVTQGFARKMGLAEHVKEVRVDEKSIDTFYSPAELSIHLGEALIRGIYTFEASSSALEDYFNWIWVDLDPVVWHDGYRFCTCKYHPKMWSQIPIENRPLNVDLHMALILCHELTHAFCEMMAYRLVPCGTISSGPSANSGEPFQAGYDPHDERFKLAFIELWRTHGDALHKAVENAGDVFGGDE